MSLRLGCRVAKTRRQLFSATARPVVSLRLDQVSLRGQNGLAVTAKARPISKACSEVSRNPLTTK